MTDAPGADDQRAGERTGASAALAGAAEALRASEARSRALLSAMNDVILVLDAQGRYREVAPTEPSLLYRPSAELIGRTLHEVFPTADADRFLDGIRTALRTRRTVHLEYRLPIGDAQVWFHGAVSPMDDETVIWVARDITERVAAEEHVRRLNEELEDRVRERTAQLEAVSCENRALLEREQAARAEAEAAQRYFGFLAAASATLASALDLDATLQNVARSAVPTLADGCMVDLVEGQGTLRHVAVAHSAPRKEAALRRLQSDYPFHLAGPASLLPALRRGEPVMYLGITDAQLTAVARDAEHLRLLRIVAPTSLLIVPLMTRGGVLGAMSFITTEPGRQGGSVDQGTAVELARRAAMAIDNARLYGEAQRALNEATAALTVRDDFLSIASHELRTPLTALKGQIQLANRWLRRGNIAPLPEMVRQAEQQVDRLARLVSTLLDASRIGGGRFVLAREPVALRPLLTRIVELERAASTTPRQIDLVLSEALPIVMADPERLELVFVNLLENARKYSPANTPIEVRGEATEHTVSVAVRDEGVGIPPEDQARIFDRFRRGSTVDQGIAGMGLGLYIAHEIVQAHGGQLHVQSTPRRGSTFTVTLPRSSDRGSDAGDEHAIRSAEARAEAPRPPR